MGDNCELGNTLVKRGYNGSSLFRFIYNPPESFLHSLENDFNGMFSLENLTPLPWGMVSDSAYNMHFHTQILKHAEDGTFILNKDDEETREIYLDELNKYKYLKKKFMERARSGSAIYIIKCNAGIKSEILDRIENELKRIAEGAPFILLEVRQSGDSIPSDRIDAEISQKGCTSG
ncbi:hypothetical protein Geu3261_0183_001 [Komagataeibacter europaeus NBRC 3261]|uniref:Uncharacterized protein n=1 Tax=Komagataeibacter europaeus NBRC 3261 TaxID=1234669 RepID=A0A0D6Q385_KOMEU|nr:hypothetical protein Geu3261_0183_001 [Komagataeibacter europaeus NBRC 3261]